MARRRPRDLRAEAARPASVSIPNVPLATSLALDRLDRPEIASAEVRWALTVWGEFARLTSAQRATTPSDVIYVGPDARDVLERALAALPRRRHAALRAVVESLDDVFREQTVPDPYADPALSWWQQRSTD